MNFKTRKRQTFVVIVRVPHKANAKFPFLQQNNKRNIFSRSIGLRKGNPSITLITIARPLYPPDKRLLRSIYLWGKLCDHRVRSMGWENVLFLPKKGFSPPPMFLFYNIQLILSPHFGKPKVTSGLSSHGIPTSGSARFIPSNLARKNTKKDRFACPLTFYMKFHAHFLWGPLKAAKKSPQSKHV